MSAILTFVTSKLGIITIAGLLAALLGAGIYVQGLRLDVARAAEAAERTRADAEKQRADDNAAVVKALQADQERANRIVADYAAEIATLQETSRASQSAVLRAPTTPCSAVPACAVYLDGMRARRGAAAAGQPAAAR